MSCDLVGLFVTVGVIYVYGLLRHARLNGNVGAMLIGYIKKTLIMDTMMMIALFGPHKQSEGHFSFSFWF